MTEADGDLDKMGRNFEVADTDNIVELCNATKRALIISMQKVLKEIQQNTNGSFGLTWDQLDFFLEKFKEKQPTIVTQNFEI